MTNEDRITELWNAHCTYDDLGASSRKDVLAFAASIRREALEEAAKLCEEWSAGIDTGKSRNRVVAAAMQGALTCAVVIRNIDKDQPCSK